MHHQRTQLTENETGAEVRGLDMQRDTAAPMRTAHRA